MRRFDSIVKDHLALGAAFSVSTTQLPPNEVHASSRRKSLGHFIRAFRPRDLPLTASSRRWSSVIVTFNLDDFPNHTLGKYGIEAQHPDEFITHLFDLNSAAVLHAAKLQRAALKRPPLEVDRFLESLSRQHLAETVSRLREFSDLL